LRAWRTERARALAWSAGRVAPDVVLEAIARRRPASRSELARIAGVGPRFLAVEAEGILGLVRSASAPESALDREGPPGRPPVS
jgi:superfamily II DNA helicase RecQ